jgi:hypothetical protein
MPLPPDFHSVLSACDFHDVPLGSIADDVRNELREYEIEQARASRQARIATALPQLRRAIEAKLKALEPQRVTLPTLPSAPTDLFLFTRQSGAQVGALHDPVARTFFDAYVAFIPAEAWSQLRAVTAHRTLDLVFVAAGPFTDLRGLWNRCANWSGVSANANSSHSPGALESVLDRLIASVPNELVATWFQNADDYLKQLLRSAAQRNAGRSDPGHFRPRWTPPWEEQAAE